MGAWSPRRRAGRRARNGAAGRPNFERHAGIDKHQMRALRALSAKFSAIRRDVAARERPARGAGKGGNLRGGRGQRPSPRSASTIRRARRCEASDELGGEIERRDHDDAESGIGQQAEGRGVAVDGTAVTDGPLPLEGVQGKAEAVALGGIGSSRRPHRCQRLRRISTPCRRQAAPGPSERRRRASRRCCRQVPSRGRTVALHSRRRRSTSGLARGARGSPA